MAENGYWRDWTNLVANPEPWKSSDEVYNDLRGARDDLIRSLEEIQIRPNYFQQEEIQIRPNYFQQLYVLKDWVLGQADAPPYVLDNVLVGDGFIDLLIEMPLWWWNDRPDPAQSGPEGLDLMESTNLPRGRYRIIQINWDESGRQWWTCTYDGPSEVARKLTSV